MTNHVIFFGYSVFSKILITRYRNNGQNFIVMDRLQNLNLDHQLLQDEERLIISQHPGDTQAMVKARINEAKMVIIGYESDADVVYAIMAINKYLQDSKTRPQIIARITYEENISLATNAGADKVIAPQLLIADEISKMNS